MANVVVSKINGGKGSLFDTLTFITEDILCVKLLSSFHLAFQDVSRENAYEQKMFSFSQKHIATSGKIKLREETRGVLKTKDVLLLIQETKVFIETYLLVS